MTLEVSWQIPKLAAKSKKLHRRIATRCQQSRDQVDDILTMRACGGLVKAIVSQGELDAIERIDPPAQCRSFLFVEVAGFFAEVYLCDGKTLLFQILNG